MIVRELFMRLLDYGIICHFDDERVKGLVGEYFKKFCSFDEFHDGYMVIVESGGKFDDLGNSSMDECVNIGNIVSYNDAKKRLVYVKYNSQASVEEIGLFVVRIIRALFRFYLCEDGWIMTHAAAYWIENCTHLLVGNKFEGKTFTLTKVLLTNNSAKFVSNDKVFIKLVDGQLFTVSIPYKVGVRVSTLKLNPQMMENYNHEILFYHNITLSCLKETMRELDVNGNVRVKYTPHEYVELLHSDIINGLLVTDYIEKVGGKTSLDYDKLFFSYLDEPMIYLRNAFKLSTEKEQMIRINLIPEIEKRFVFYDG